MAKAEHQARLVGGREVVDFDDALFGSWPADEQADLLREAQLLASVFAPDGGVEPLRRMAEQLSNGERDPEFGRRHARRLAAALKQLAKAA